MPRIIHRALLERLVRLPEVHDCLRDFRALTGLDLRLLDEYGHDVSEGHREPALCAALRRTAAGCQLCGHVRRRLLRRETAETVQCHCDAGLEEVAVPLRVSGQTVGFLVFCGFRHGPAGGRELRRAQHLLARGGVELAPGRHRMLLQRARRTPPAQAEAMARLVGTLAQHFGFLASHHALKETNALPPLAHHARRYLRSHGLGEHCRLSEVAHACGVSSSHLSRVFHQSTGLTLSEYLARFRVEHAVELLRAGQTPVTDVAFASGFRSLSQFNRTFKRLVGCAPTRLRQSAADAAVSRDAERPPAGNAPVPPSRAPGG
jgi:AraC-like DNA-binding protein